MDYSQKISKRLWNMPDKGELESPFGLGLR